MSATRIGTLVPVVPLLFGLFLCGCEVKPASLDPAARAPDKATLTGEEADLEEDAADVTRPDTDPVDAATEPSADTALEAARVAIDAAPPVQDASSDGAPTGDLSSVKQGDVTFTARQGSVNVEVEVSKPGAVYLKRCSNATTLEKQSGDSWAALRDDTYPSFNSPGYYLDGDYRGPIRNNGCDVLGCDAVSAPIRIAPAVERVQTGTRPPPAGQPGVESPARDIQTQRYGGKVRVTLRYSLDAKCEHEQEVQLQLEVPAGVCCPTGNSCSNTNSGGWAISDDQCAGRRFFDGSFTPIKDVHGCDALHLSTSSGAICCGCPRDAGV